MSAMLLVPQGGTSRLSDGAGCKMFFGSKLYFCGPMGNIIRTCLGVSTFEALVLPRLKLLMMMPLRERQKVQAQMASKLFFEAHTSKRMPNVDCFAALVGACKGQQS